MVRRRIKRRRSGFGLPAAEHEKDVAYLIGSAAERVFKAEQGYARGQCLAAGKEIDQAYYTLGEAGGHIQGAQSGSNAKWRDVFDRLHRIDEKFEKHCVKRRPS